MSIFFVCKHKTAYEMRISDWSSDVCSSDLRSSSISTAHWPTRRAIFAKRQTSFSPRMGVGAFRKRAYAISWAAARACCLSADLLKREDRKSVVSGKSVSVSVDHGGRRILKKQNKQHNNIICIKR